MELVVLGSGSSVPHPQRSSSGYWLETLGGSLLMDCSASAIHRMAQERLDWANLDAIWISHFHLDHVGGLPPLLFAMKYAPQTQGRTKPLRICGPSGIQKLLKDFSDVRDYRLLEQPFPVEVCELNPLEDFAILPNVKAVIVKTPHTDESHAIHIDSGGKTLVYSADTGFSLPLAEAAKSVDLFICECSFVRNKPVELHIELAEAIYLSRIAKPKKMLLTHFYPEWDEVDFEAEVAKFGPLCEVQAAFDGLRLVV